MFDLGEAMQTAIAGASGADETNVIYSTTDLTFVGRMLSSQIVNTMPASIRTSPGLRSMGS